MNKNRVAVIIAVLFTVVVLIFGWFYLHHVMDKYDVDKKDWDETSSLLQDEDLPSSAYLKTEVTKNNTL